MAKAVVGIECGSSRLYGGPNDMYADVVPGQSIRIYGTYGQKQYDKTFRLGDQAEYGSYNLTYYGPITKITANTVTMRCTGGESKRLKLREFSWRNHNFDLATVRARNSEEMMYL